MAAYFGLLLLISRLTSRSNDNNAFFRGNRQSPWWLVAFGMIGTSISGVSVVSVPGMVRDANMSYLQMCLGFVPGYLLVAFVLLPVYYKLRLTSIYDYLSRRFGSASHKTGASFFLISKLCGAAARMFMACLVLQKFVFAHFGIPFEATAVVTLLLTWAYTRKSGVKTLVWTDALQTLALIAAVATIWITVSGAMHLNLNSAVHFISESPYGRIFVFDADSMADVRIKNVMLNNIVTSLGKQPGYDATKSSLSYFKNFIDNADSLVRGGATSLDDPNIHQPYLSKIVEGTEPFEVSNGYAYAIDNYGYVPSKSWHTTIRVEAEYQFYQDINGFASAEKNGNYYGNSVYLTSLNRNDSIKGYVSNNSFAYFPGSSSASQPTVSFKIPNILSGKYDIYAVMVPLNMDKKTQSVEETKRNHFSASIVYDYNDRNGRDIEQAAVAEDGSKEFETRAGVIDSVLLFKDFEFPYAFKGAEPCYPKLKLKSVVRTAAQKKIYDPALYIDCFLFVSKDDESDN